MAFDCAPAELGSMLTAWCSRGRAGNGLEKVPAADLADVQSPRRARQKPPFDIRKSTSLDAVGSGLECFADPGLRQCYWLERGGNQCELWYLGLAALLAAKS